MRRIAVVIPALNEEARIGAALASVSAAASALPHGAAQVSSIVVDGGSSDRTSALAGNSGAVVIAAPAGRAAQMNAGAATTAAEVLLFLHADARLSGDCLAELLASLGAAPARAAWGRFDVRLEPSTPLLRVVAAAMNLRSRLTGIATGDQAIFMTRAAWDLVGGFPALPLMEDVEISRRLKAAVGRPLCLHAPVEVSARRWRTNGVWRTIVTMWWYRALYALGASPEHLHRRYYGEGAGVRRAAAPGGAPRSEK